MIDGVRQNLTYLDPAARKGSKADGTSSAGRSASASAPAAEAEIIQVSSTASGPSSPPLDRARIDKIRDAIRNNAYPIDYDALAERMIEADISRYDLDR
jgi:anti-sigma28 factor (negative regulator of flagellin synthesis)